MADKQIGALPGTTDEPVRLNEAALRLIVDGIPGMLSIASADGRHEYANRPMLGYLGKAPSELSALGWLDACHPDEQDAARARWHHCIGAAQALNIRSRLRRADGVYRWFQAYVVPHFGEDGQLLRWHGLFVDIDDQTRAEDALRKSERDLRFLVDGIPGLLCVCAPDGELEYVNQPMLDLIGHPLEESKRFGWASTIHPEDRGDLVTRWIEATSSGRILDHEYRRRCPDGEYRWFHARMKPQFDGDGRILRWFALIVDIDARRTAELALRASELGLRRLIETIPALTWSATADGDPDYLNQRGVDYTGRSLADFKLLGWRDLIHPDDLEETNEAWARAVKIGGSYDVKHRLRAADGQYRWFHVRGEALRDGDGRVIHFFGLNTGIDTSERLEEDLRRTRERLSRAARVTAVAELSASVAHELSQPLAAVVTNGNACKRWLDADPPNIVRAKLTVEKIVEDGSSAGAVLSRIRALFKQSAPNKLALDLNQVISEVCSLLAGDFAASGTNLRSELDRSLPLISADRVQMQQMLVNLLHNGIEAMQFLESPIKELSIRSALLDGNRVLVAVRDHGVGLADPEKIFESFFTTKENGLGMGLAICRSIVESHGGQLWATNNEDRGATFSFSLPIHA